MSLQTIDKPRQRINAMGCLSSKAGSHNQSSTSMLDQLYQQGSARIRFPNTEPGPLQAVLLNTAGGLTGNDHIQWQASAEEHSHLSISTAACEKIYRTHGPAAIQQTTLHVANKARLEWLPQESILFNGSHLNRSMDVHLEENAQALIVESLIFGRQAMNEDVDSIVVRDRWRIYRNKQLLHAEDLYLDMNHHNNARTQCVLHQFSAIATIVMIGNQTTEWFETMVASARKLAPADPAQTADPAQIRVGASALPSRLVVRALASDSFQLRKFLIPCIELLNSGRPVPTVWKV